MTRWSLAIPLLALGACAMGPDYRRPELTVPGSHRGQPEPEAGAQAESASTLGELGFWDLYRDPMLRSLIRAALVSNYDVRIAVSRIEQANAALGGGRIEQLPSLEAGASVQRRRVPAQQVPPGADRTGNQFSLSLGLSWELDFWGRLRRTTEALRAEWLATRHARRAAQISLIAEVAETYFNLVTLDEQLAITRATVTTREQFLMLTRAKAERGVVSGLDVASAEAQLALAQSTVPDLEREIAQAEHALSLLLGRNPGSIPRAEPGQAPLLTAPELPIGLPSSLLERRPDVMEAEQRLVAANARVGAAKAALFPTISLTGALGLIAPDLASLFSDSAQSWSAGVGVVQPLLDGERNAYRVDLADARKREALLRYELAVKSAFREVADALVARQKFAERERFQNALVDAQSRAEQIASSRYRAGYSSYFDVINAGRDLFDAQLARSTARLSALLATVRLYRALGGGFGKGN
jgi:outer membrane protein, multidrug efflux system